jgi:four helix bundle protein
MCIRLQATRAWPREELFGLTSQARRAAAAVPANIAEGHGRLGPKEFLHHLSIAVGSLHELETHLQLAQRLEFLDEDACSALEDQTAEVGRLLGGLIRSLRGDKG